MDNNNACQSQIKAMSRHFTGIKNTMRPALENRFSYLSYKLPKFIKRSKRSLNEFNRIYNEIESVNTTRHINVTNNNDIIDYGTGFYNYMNNIIRTKNVSIDISVTKKKMIFFLK